LAVLAVVPAALAGMALLGAISISGFITRCVTARSAVIIATIGASDPARQFVLAIYGPQPQVLEGWFETPGIQLGPVYLDSQYLLIIAVTIVLVIFNYWFFERTMPARSCRRPLRTRRWLRCSASPSPP